MKTMNYSLLLGFLLGLLAARTLPSHDTRAGFLLTLGIVLALVAINLLIATLVKRLLPDGPVKHTLLRLRGHRQ
jgi:uncharacterized membrane protein YeaQ/YmgE (transglycosylase-associated protein family)